MVVLLIFLLVTLAGLIIALLLAWQRFHADPRARQALAVLEQGNELASNLNRLRQQSAQSQVSLQKRLDGLRAKLYAEQLRSVRVCALGEYPGIGPATIETLICAGVETLEQARTFPVESLSGLGPKRLVDVKNALRDLTLAEDSKFSSGSSPVGWRFQEEKKQLQTTWERECKEREAGMAKLQKHIWEVEPVLKQAGQATFLAWLCKLPLPENLPDIRLPCEAKTPTPEIPKVEKPATPSVKEPDNRWSEVALVARFAIAVARADGRLAKEELLAARLFLMERFAQEENDRGAILEILQKEEETRATVKELLPLVKSRLNSGMKQKLYQLSCRITDASGPRNAREEAVLEMVKELVEFPSEVDNSTQPVEKATTNKPDPRKTLEFLPATDLTPARVREQWKNLQDRFDPEKFSNLGEEFISLARSKREAINAAAKELLTQLGDTPTLEAPRQDPRHNPDLDKAFGF